MVTAHEHPEQIDEVESGFARHSAPRHAVIDAVLAQSGLFTAEELCLAVSGVGRATVYRTLARLQDEGVVCRVPVEGGGMRYRLGEARHHHHLVCLECGDVQDIAGCGVDDFVGGIAREFGYELVDHRLDIYGRCSACSTQSS